MRVADLRGGRCVFMQAVGDAMGLRGGQASSQTERSTCI
jgi:hypothetical protein